MAQGVTTGSIAGIVDDSQGGILPGATVTAVHEPSGTVYDAVTQGDGRFFMPGMRVGGPYKITVTMAGLATEVKSNVTVSLGTSTDLHFTLKVAGVAEQVTVQAGIDPTFSSGRTGAATVTARQELATLPTISGRINDVARLTPQYGGTGSFAGQDNRMNNITIDGSYFNNSFGLGGQPGDRTGVAPISLEAIEQVQISVAPYDVRQGNFVGAGINAVTRSGTNRLTGSFYRRMRNESFVGTEAAGQTFNPGTFTTYNTGGWLGGPILRNKLFAFGSFENQDDTRPLTTFRSNPGGVPNTGNITRVLASDLTAISQLLSSSFNYQTGAFDDISKKTPGKPFLVKTDYNLNGSNKISFRYNQLSSSTDVNESSSSSLGFGRQTNSNNYLNFAASNYSILENIKSGVGELNSVLGSTMSNSLIIGYTHQDESRGDIGTLFPFIDILDGAGAAYTSVGSEPFTPNNELRYNTFQLQDNFTKFWKSHSVTFGASVEKYHSENVFYPGKQSAYVYNTLADFYTDLNGYLANPGRTSSPVNLRRFQVRYVNIPGMDKPIQPLDVWYTGGYVQDEWRPRSNLSVTAGVRVDVATFGNTAYDNPVADAMTFRNGDGSAVQYNTGALPKSSPLWSPRLGFNWDLNRDQTTQVRGGTGIFTGKPPYVWISNQVGNTGVLTGFIQADNTTAYPFNPNPDAYKPASVTGAPAASIELNVTDPDFKFPQTWRTNIGVDRKLPWGMVGTFDYMYNRDVNGVAYINANLPAAQSAFTGVDNRPRWVGTSCATATPAPCVTRLNNVAGQQVTNAIVLDNQNEGRSWNVAASVAKRMSAGFQVKGAYAYAVSRSLVDPGSTATNSWTSNGIAGDPNNPILGYSANSPGHRYFISASYTREYFKWGATTIAAFWDAHTNGNTSYVFSGDMNGDSASGNDLIYIPRNTGEMNFSPFTTAGVTYTADQQAQAFESFIQKDPYLNSHRGEYAKRNAVFLPMVGRLDLSLTQDVFGRFAGGRHSGQIRLDVTNFGNLLNHDWGVGERIVQNQILTNATADAEGRATYRMALVNGGLPTNPRQTTAGISDVYVMMLSFRYTFQ